jgi:LPS O-antigen subunit length determinant protein (WzzB/FepE family)
MWIVLLIFAVLAVFTVGYLFGMTKRWVDETITTPPEDDDRHTCPFCNATFSDFLD